MSLTSGPNLGLLVNGVAGEEHFNELMRQWRGFDVLVQCRALDKDLSAPPGSPTDGDTYIVGASPSGAWSAHATHIARWSSLSGIGWEFYTPKEGWQSWLADEDKQYRFNGTGWAEIPSSSGTTLPSPRVVSASTTLAAADVDNGVTTNVASANTVTVPTNATEAIAVNSSIPLLVKGVGLTTVVAAIGVSIRTAAPLTLALRAQWSQAVLTKIATDEWTLTGDLA